MSDAPIVSILMPVAKVRQYLPIAMESALTQTFTALELILIDDDGRAEELGALVPPHDPRVHAIASKGKGISDALNTGIEAAAGRFVCRVDCDDLIPPDRIARQVRFLEQHPDYSAVCGAMSTMTSAGQPVADVNARHSAAEITTELRNGITRCSLCTYLLRTDSVRQTGGFRPWFVTAEDIDFALRFGERFRVYYEAMPTYWYRLHDASITHSQASDARAFFEESARQFQSQRLKTGHDDLELGHPPQPPAGNIKPRGSAQAVQELLVGQSWAKHRSGQKAEALRLGWRACLAKPTTLWSWRSLAALAIKPPGASTK
jgi:glycosyltransferase involved in cell wall biosynthesis